MWRILSLMTDSPSGDMTRRSRAPRERHKTGTLTAFPDVSQGAERSQKLVKPQCPRVTQIAWISALCVRFRPSCGRPDSRHACSSSLSARALCGAVGAAGGAETANSFDIARTPLRARTTRSRTVSTARCSTSTRSTRKLDRAQSRLAALESTSTRIAARQRAIRMRLDIARQDLRISQTDGSRSSCARSTSRTRRDPLAVILGAESLEDALATLDDLARSRDAAFAGRRGARAPRGRLTSITGRLATRGRADRARSRTTQRERPHPLEATQAERRRYIAIARARRREPERRRRSRGLDAPRAGVRRAEPRGERGSARRPLRRPRSRRRTGTRAAHTMTVVGDRLLGAGRDRHRPLDRLGNRRRRPVGDPARDANDHPGLRRGRRRGHRRARERRRRSTSGSRPRRRRCAGAAGRSRSRCTRLRAPSGEQRQGQHERTARDNASA